jgi:hypothetical protein
VARKSMKTNIGEIDDSEFKNAQEKWVNGHADYLAAGKVYEAACNQVVPHDPDCEKYLIATVEHSKAIQQARDKQDRIKEELATVFKKNNTRWAQP